MLRSRLATALAGLVVAALPVVAAPSAQAATHDPVITIYGFGGYSQQFDPIKSKLVASGWASNRIFDFGYIGIDSNVNTAKSLKNYVDDVKRRTGAAKVDLLVHSMGAISSRYYLKSLGGSANVDAWVSLGGANKGTTYPLLALCAPIFPACADMTPGSQILTGLNTGDPTPGTTRYFTFTSSCDGVITPASNLNVDTATNIPVIPCVGHNDYFSNVIVQTLIPLQLG